MMGINIFFKLPTNIGMTICMSELWYLYLVKTYAHLVKENFPSEEEEENC